MKHIITILLVLSTSLAFAQSETEKILKDISQNNTELKVLQNELKADSLYNMTGLMPNNPELEFNYLWGNPDDIGNRKDLRISQSFDFPTVYTYKKKIANVRNEQLALEFKKRSMEINYEARILCTELVYYNKLISKLEIRLFDTQRLTESYKIKTDKGDTGILEYNKVRLREEILSADLKSANIKRQSLLDKLSSMNGGITINSKDKNYSTPMITQDFEKWFNVAEQNNPVLAWLKDEIQAVGVETKLLRAESLPGFQAGYMSEKVAGEEFSGITVGVTIPLWENKNRIKYAKANFKAAGEKHDETRLQFYYQLKATHSKAVSLQTAYNSYRTGLDKFDNGALLNIAFTKGGISLIDYLNELAVFYESADKALELEKDMNLTIEELYRYQ